MKCIQPTNFKMQNPISKFLWLARFVFGLVLVSIGINALKADVPPDGNTIYDSNPKHLWNRLNETLFIRTAQDGKKYGVDELDILYWSRTKNLLVEPSHQQALAVLDEFIDTRGEKLIRDPLKRALLQRDLWELFDWSAKPFRNSDDARACRELQSRFVLLIRRLALTTNEIALLPDNYAQAEKNKLPDLPQGLIQTNGNWELTEIKWPRQRMFRHSMDTQSSA